MEALDLNRFKELFQKSYAGRDVLASLYANELFGLSRIIGQTDDLSWFTNEYFKQFYDHVLEVYCYDDCSDCSTDGTIRCRYSDEWSFLVKLDNGFYLSLQANTCAYSGFSGYGDCKMFASRDIDQLITFVLTDALRNALEKAQTAQTVVSTRRQLSQLSHFK